MMRFEWECQEAIPGSTPNKDQNLDLQLDALRLHGCKRFLTDTVSGAKAKRPGLDEILKEARPKDVIVIWKLDRLGRLRFAH